MSSFNSSLKNADYKRFLLVNIPYIFVMLFMTKVWQSYRLSSGVSFRDKILGITEGITLAFQSYSPSFHSYDLEFGLIIALIFKYAVYTKSKNAKKFRKGVEYGSARWGNKKDIEPFTDTSFNKNVILTKTENLTMESRPKNPKHARNKNVLIVGGSGSGKTRFWLKPNLMQMHSSYCITDPKGLTFRRQIKPLYFPSG